jgi:hypothetical protein
MQFNGRTPLARRHHTRTGNTRNRGLAGELTEPFHRLLDPPRPVAYPRDLAGLGVGSSLMGAAAGQGIHRTTARNCSKVAGPTQPVDGSKWNQAREIDGLRARLSGSHDRCEWIT